MIPVVNILDYTYDLPDERIAKYPLPQRDSSKLLEFKDGCITDHVFSDIPSLLPSDAMMVFNQTRVVPARLHFRRESGAHIEVFCLRPIEPEEYVKSFEAKGSVVWKCVVGNIKRWKADEKLILMNPGEDAMVDELQLKATLLERMGETSIVRLEWLGDHSFSEVLDICGTIPIPPYLNRETQSIDLERYQTTYAVQKGSVAAPTAGLHFTDRTMADLQERGIDIEKVCLHVGAGTFLPVKCQYIKDHPMHREPFAVSTAFIKKLKKHKEQGKPVIAVGTTSVRTLESLYWAGVQCLRGIELHDVNQWEPYEDSPAPDAPAATFGATDSPTSSAPAATFGATDSPDGFTLSRSLDALLQYADRHNLTEISLGTTIIIVPGYKLRVVDTLVTNFHQPQSTLLLLISAFVGENWHKIYRHALDNSYRFLSYGDSSLLYKL